MPAGPHRRRRPRRRAFARTLPPGAVVALVVGVGAYRWSDARAVEDAAVAGAGVLLASVVAAAGVALSDPRVGDARGLAELTGLTVLAALPRRAAGHAAGAPGDVESLRSAVAGATAAATPRVVVVAGAASADGGSAVARTLAEAFARNGTRTLLVDGNLHRPTLHQEYLLSRARGATLGDHLSARGAPSGATADGAPLVLPRVRLGADGAGPSLWVLPTLQAAAGESAPALAGIAACLPRWGRDVEVIVIDAPPLTEADDVLVVAPHATGTLLVSDVLRSPRRRVRATLDALHRSGARVIGAVATGAPERRRPPPPSRGPAPHATPHRGRRSRAPRGRSQR